MLAPRWCRLRGKELPAQLAFFRKVSTLWWVWIGLRPSDAPHMAERTQMAKFKALSRGSQLVLVAGPLLFLSLFFTWQYVEVDYGRAGIATISLDGWDAWGLLLALLVLATISLVALQSFTEGELSDDVPWSTISFGLGAAVFAVAAVKNLTDAGSSWLSYGFVGLAGAVLVGAYLDWAAGRRSERRPTLARKRRGLRSAA
jgi:multisubunit Na+/H+ antiporter MnhB subunit